jgi:predicted flap endonuclease-1-like 5' DNA nuclease
MLAITFLGQEAGEGSIGWMVWVALLIFAVMVALGWLVSSKGWLKKEEEPVHDVHAHAEHEEEHAHVKPAQADDLTELEGIGPKVAKVLEGIGITTFAGLAGADIPKLREALDAAGYKYMEPAGWIEQAALAAKGDTEGLKKLQESLKGGRKVA